MILVPAYNEGTMIRSVVELLVEQASATVVIIDDGSPEPAKNQITGLPVIVLRHLVNLGQGAALQTGLNYARKEDADIVVTFDADGQHNAADLPALLQPLLNGEADIVLGSRFHSSNDHPVPFLKKMVLKTGRIINFLFTGILLSDAHNGLRAFNKAALRHISITENRMAHASEILFQIKKHRLRFREVPVTIRYTAYSRKKGQHASEGIKIVFDLILNKLFK